MIPSYYREYMKRYVQNALWWNDGWVPYFHNQDKGILSTRLAGAIVDRVARKVAGSRIMYKNVGESFTDGFITDGEFLAQYMKCSQDCLLVTLLIGTLELHIYIAGFAAFQMICVEVLGEKNRCILSLRFVFEYWSGLFVVA